MVGYNDAYNRALTAKSNALQRRKGQMIDHLNGAGRGDEDSEDDYLSEEGMEGGAAAYEDEYEEEMVGGSFEEASREVGGAMTFGGRSVGGRPTGGRPTGGRLTGGFFPAFLAAAAAPLVASAVGKLFGGAYTGGARQVKSAMLADMRGSADPRLKRGLSKLRDVAYSVGMDAIKKSGAGRGGVSGLTGGRATGGFLPFLAPLAMAAAPALGSAIGKMFGLGRKSPIMRGAGFFDWISNAAQTVGNALAPVGRFLAPVAEFARDNILPAVGNLAKDAAVDYAKQKIAGKGKCCSACKGSGLTFGGRKQSPYDLAYGGRQTAQSAFDREDERIGMEVRGLKDAERRNKEKNYALGAGGKRLYMSGGQAPVAAMGRESLYGYDNDEQGEGLMPPRNVATKGYMSGCGAMPMYSCGGRALTPVAQMKGVIGGRSSGGRASAWISHVKAYAAKHGVSYKDALKSARATYRA